MKIFYLLLFFFFSHTAIAQITRLDPNGFSAGLGTDSVQLLDVRTAREYGSGHIINALQADWNNKKEFKERVSYIDKNKPVYIYCLSGARSEQAAAWMRESGFTRVVELVGGLHAWKLGGKPVEDAPDEKQMTPEEYYASIPSGQTVLVDFGAAWCPPCMKMEPVITSLRNDPSLQFAFVRIDAGVHTDLVKALKIEPIPVFIIYRDGKEVWRKHGIVTRDELAKLLK